MVVFTTFAKPAPPALSTPPRFSITRWACSFTSPTPTISPVFGSSGICPEQKIILPAGTEIAWLYGPMAFGASLVWITLRLDMARTLSAFLGERRCEGIVERRLRRRALGLLLRLRTALLIRPARLRLLRRWRRGRLRTALRRRRGLLDRQPDAAPLLIDLDHLDLHA